MSERNRKTIVCQITRGLAPASAIVHTVQGAQHFRHRYLLISGLGRVDAKNAAVRAALDDEAHLLLVEDDIEVPWSQWPTSRGNVWVATARCSNGDMNTEYDSHGHVLKTGTPFILIPYRILFDLSDQGTQPIFRARKFRIDGNVLVDYGPTDTDRGSDIWFCYLCRMRGYSIGVCGHGTSLKHSLINFGPSKMEVLA
jgi:hypothetical protein